MSEQAERLAAFTARHPWIVIRRPDQNGDQWRASWLTPVKKGGAEEVKRPDDGGLLDYLEARFGS